MANMSPKEQQDYIAKSIEQLGKTLDSTQQYIGCKLN